MKFSRDYAVEIATEVLHYMNPAMWNGFGEKPESLDTRTYEVPLKDNLSLEIVLCPSDDGDGWMHYVDVVCGGDSIACESGYGIDSVNNLADTILDLCCTTI